MIFDIDFLQFRIEKLQIEFSKRIFQISFAIAIFCCYRFLQHCHIPDTFVGRMTGFWSFATAIGVMLGGRVSDRMHVWNKNRGRILTAQFSMGISIPLFVIMFIFIPRQAHFWWAFLMIKTLKAFFGTWGLWATKIPIISEITEPHKRASVNAWYAASAGIIGDSISGPLIGWMIQHVFGFQSIRGKRIEDLSVEQVTANGTALASGMAFVNVICGSLSVLMWFFVYRTFPRDRDYIEEVNRRHAENQRSNDMRWCDVRCAWVAV
jgi:MFS family permease